MKISEASQQLFRVWGLIVSGAGGHSLMYVLWLENLNTIFIWLISNVREKMILVFLISAYSALNLLIR